MLNRDTAIKIRETAFEILASLDEKYKTDEVKAKVLNTLITENQLADMVENSIRFQITELIEYYDFYIYKIASGQGNYPSGGKVTAGFVTDKMNEIKPEEVNK